MQVANANASLGPPPQMQRPRAWHFSFAGSGSAWGRDQGSLRARSLPAEGETRPSGQSRRPLRPDFSSVRPRDRLPGGCSVRRPRPEPAAAAGMDLRRPGVVVLVVVHLLNCWFASDWLIFMLHILKGFVATFILLEAKEASYNPSNNLIPFLDLIRDIVVAVMLVVTKVTFYETSNILIPILDILLDILISLILLMTKVVFYKRSQTEEGHLNVLGDILAAIILLEAGTAFYKQFQTAMWTSSGKKSDIKTT
ncbi:uncharacterized protein LOC125428817 isoform X2 [Sphaerodactylus townsendi]|uniref:uncharacterized protein LOC125428817 isoform X2 n=1 Tax=Sphaerodactylus townsendi TaxID=933632 RepID=UPI002026AA39|nr:uncharacterized protein LOC125428817 isoform X2 [Sphaerodactylus townsendi]